MISFIIFPAIHGFLCEWRALYKMEKCAIFIDGGYFSKILKKYFNNSGVDYLEFSNEMAKIIQSERLRTYFYHSLPYIRSGNEQDQNKKARMQKFLSKLKRLPRFEIKLGKLQLIGGEFKQKMVDVLMSLDIVEMCFGKKISEVLVVAGDSDFVPAIKKAKDCGAIVHLFYHPKSVHNELLDNVDEIHEIDNNLINLCLMRK